MLVSAWETALLSAPADCLGSLSALGRRHEESETGVGDEESTDTSAGKEDSELEKLVSRL